MEEEQDVEGDEEEEVEGEEGENSARQVRSIILRLYLELEVL